MFHVSRTRRAGVRGRRTTFHVLRFTFYVLPFIRQESPMQVRLLLGPAGSGKTFRCLAEIREALSAAPEGPPLLLIAPKQTTYQLERQLLADASIQGYTRLHILSFERLARSVFEMLNQPAPDLLDEEGRLMVLRAILAKKKNELKLF